MKFGRLLLVNRVPEWAEAYVEYNILKKLLSPAKILEKKFVLSTYKEGNIVYRISNRKNLRIDEVIQCVRSFEYLIKNEIIKLDKFFQYKLLDLMQRYKLLMINSSFILKSLNSQQRTDNESKLKYSYKIFYKEMNMVNDYIKLNQTALQKILKKYSKVVKSLQKVENEEFNLAKRVQAEKSSTYLARNQDKLLNIMKKTENHYIDCFYPDIQQQKNGRKDFRLYTTPRPLSSNQILFYGIFCGISCLLLLFIILKFIEVYSEEPSAVQKTRLSRIFPLFRGNGLFITYIWLLAWNVHGWQNNHINYKLIFKFNHHFSQMYQILQRAAFFTFVYFICFVWYIILNTPHENKSHGVDLYSLVDWIDMDILPIFGWLILLCYIFFPFFKVSFFNPEGRLYFFKLLLNCLKSPFVQMEFKIAWMTDMLVSFAGPLKDFETTICFYISKAQGNVTDYCNSDSRITQFLLNIVPTVYRMLQCCRQGYDKKLFWRTLPFYNLLKYAFSLITSLLSYQYSISKSKSDLIYWLIIGAISTLYSFYWDIAQDWGLLKIGKTWKDTQLIGRKIYYGSRNFYLFAIFTNFLLRIVWALNISLGLTEIIDKAMNIPELYRRCQWNFFRVELEHINNCNQYKAVVDLDLPIKVDIASSSSSQNQIKSQKEILTTQNKNTEEVLIKNEGEYESQNMKSSNQNILLNINYNLNPDLNCIYDITPIAPKSPTDTDGLNQNIYSNHRPQISIMGTTYDYIKTSIGLPQQKPKIDLSNGVENENDEVKIKPQIIIKNNTNQILFQSKEFSKVLEPQIQDKDEDYKNQFKKEQQKIQNSLKQFQDQLKKGITSDKIKKSLKLLKEIKPFLISREVNQVQIQSQYSSHFDEEQLNLNI